MYWRMLGKGLNYPHVSFFSVVSKVFEKLVNNRIVDHQEKCGLFSDFQYGFRFSWSTADLLTVASDRIVRAFWAVALGISKVLDRVCHADLFHTLKSYGISGQGSSGQFRPKFRKAPFLVLHFCCYTLMTFLIMLSVILLSMLMILLFILSVIRHLICGSNLNWLLNLNLI